VFVGASGRLCRHEQSVSEIGNQLVERAFVPSKPNTDRCSSGCTLGQRSVFDVVTKYTDGIRGGCGNHCVLRQLPVIKNFGGLRSHPNTATLTRRSAQRIVLYAKVRLGDALISCLHHPHHLPAF
jgi:hypothetical protein